jgi:hypothetical protein
VAVTAATPVRNQPPPPAVLRLVNPVMRRLMRSPLGRRMKPSIVLLCFTGRRTGRRLEVPVGMHDIDGVPTVFTSGTWRANFAGGYPVTLVRQGRELPALGELVDAPDEVGAALRAALRQVPARRLGLSVERGREPSAGELAALGRSMIRLRIDAG